MGNKNLWHQIVFCLFSSVFLLSFVDMNAKGLTYWFILEIFVILIVSKEKISFKPVKNPQILKLYFLLINLWIALIQTNTLKNHLESLTLVNRLISQTTISANLFFKAAFIGIFVIDFLFLFWLENVLFNPHEKNKASFFDSDNFLFFSAAVFILVYGLLTVYSINDYLWIDESFTIGTIQHGYSDIVALTAMDVHPPLYYLLLKMFAQLVLFIVPGADLIVISRLFSIVPMIILGWTSITWVRHTFGNFSSSCTLLALCAAPFILKYATEIRMYSWGMLFATLAYISFYFSLKKASWPSIASLSISSLMAAYTHYYCAVAVSLFWIVLLMYETGLKKWSDLKYSVSGILVCLLGYLPWIVVLLRQISVIKGDYWIEPLTPDIVRLYFEDILSGSCWLVLLVPVLIRNIRKSADIKSVSFLEAMTGIGLLFYVIGAGILISVFIRPFFVIRYAVPCLFSYWLGISVLSGLSGFPRVKPMFIFILLLLFLKTVPDQFEFLKNRRTEVEELKELANWNEAAVISDSNYAARNLSKILNISITDISTENTEGSQLLQKIFPEISYENPDSVIPDSEKQYYLVEGEDSDHSNLDLFKNKYELKPVWEGFLGEPFKVYELDFS